MLTYASPTAAFSPLFHWFCCHGDALFNPRFAGNAQLMGDSREKSSEIWGFDSP
jgi:hypothetical protein